MKTPGYRLLVLALLCGTLIFPCFAWNQSTQTAIVSNASRLLTRDAEIPLARLEKDVLRGARASREELLAVMPSAEGDPFNAIGAQMFLLKSMRGSRIDPYFAYRLGMLGKIVAEATAPMQDANPAYRTMYYNDVDQHLERVPLQAGDRQIVDPQSYLTFARSAAEQRQDMILKDYEAGLGFKGVAGGALSEDLSRSINAVADVWYTILTGGATMGNIPESDLRQFGISAVAFYIERGNEAEADEALSHLEGLGLMNSDVHKRVGDMYFDAEQYERAMLEYEQVLQVEPNRRDVAERVAEYHLKLGERALSADKLEEAQQQFEQASNMDKLNEAATTGRLDAERMIAARAERRAQEQAALTEAQNQTQQAQAEAQRRNYGRAIELLENARAQYAMVTGEFVEFTHEADDGLETVESQLVTIRNQLFGNVTALSGSGSAMAAKSLAESASQEVDKEALKLLMELGLKDQLEKMNTEIRQEIR